MLYSLLVKNYLLDNIDENKSCKPISKIKLYFASRKLSNQRTILVLSLSILLKCYNFLAETQAPSVAFAGIFFEVEATKFGY